MVLADQTTSLSEMAGLLGVGERRVQQLAKDGVFPKAKSGRYALAACVRGYCESLRDRAIGPVGEAGERLLKARATLAEIAVLKARGEVVLVSIAESVAADEYARLRARLLWIPDKLAPVLDAMPGVDEKREMIRMHVIEALRELSGGGDAEPEAAAGN